MIIISTYVAFGVILLWDLENCLAMETNQERLLSFQGEDFEEMLKETKLKYWQRICWWKF
jgi:hypothetical protein